MEQRFLLFAFFLALTPLALPAQKLAWIINPEEGLRPMGKPSSSGLAFVEKNILKLANEKGERQPISFDSISNLGGGWWEVWKSGLKGLWTPEKGSVIPCVYDYVQPVLIQSDCWAFAVSKYGMKAVVNDRNRLILPWRSESYSGYAFINDTLLEYISKKGYNFTNMGYTSRSGTEVKEQMALAQKKGHLKRIAADKYAFSTVEKGKILRDTFAAASEFVDDIAIVKKDSLFGYLRRDGSWLVKPAFQVLSPFDRGGRAVAKQKGKFGIFNRKGAWVAAARFETLKPLNGVLYEYKEAQKTGLIDSLGNILLPAGNYQTLLTAGTGSFGVRIADSILVYNYAGKPLPLPGVRTYVPGGDLFLVGIRKRASGGVGPELKGVAYSASGDWLLFPVFAGLLNLYDCFILAETHTVAGSTIAGIEKNIPGKYMVFNRKGVSLLPEVLDEAPKIGKEPYFVFKVKNKFGLATTEGVFLEPAYDEIILQPEGWVSVRAGLRWGALKWKG
jgi:WG containing repeat